jgi:cation transport ATPase
MKNPLLKPYLQWLLGTNLVASVILGTCLLLMLQKTEGAYVLAAAAKFNEMEKQKQSERDAAAKSKEKVNQKQSEPDAEAKSNVKVEQKQSEPDAAAKSKEKVEQKQPKLDAVTRKQKSVQDSIAADSLRKAQYKEKEEREKEQLEKGVTFYLIVLLMLISGALGGILCNLRGFFMHYREVDGYFPANLEIPYYVRPFMGGGAGIFVYFVANFLITSLTTEYKATNVPFQGMVSFVALAILAGFGSLEFFQRLKETALTTFGQKAEKDRWQKIEDLYALNKKGVLTDDEFTHEKKELLNVGSALESFINKGK